MSAESNVTAAEQRTSWSWPTRIVFRFFFVYWLLYSLPKPLDEMPNKASLEKLKPYAGWAATPLGWLADAAEPVFNANAEWVLTPFRTGEQHAVPWVGEHVLGLKEKITYFPSGSGDKPSDYVRNLIVLAAAAAAALVWSLLDFRRKSYPLLADLLRVYVRFVLGATMLAYGGFKVVPLQFSAPGVERLMQPIGESSPMGLLWTFMGASAAYTSFAGVGEVLGGLLLLFRRTATLGALVTFGVMANVVAMNFCYDVPVKLYSTNLLLMALFVMAPDLGRLADVLLFNRPAPARELGPPWKRIPWLHWPLFAFKLLFVAWLLAAHVGMAFILFGERDQFTRAELVGIFNVEEFKRDGAVQPPLVSDGAQWRRLIFNERIFMGKGFCTIRRMDDVLIRCTAELDGEKKKLTLSPRDHPEKRWEFALARPDEKTLTLEGDMDGARLAVRLTLAKPPEFLLQSRGFHWVQELPYNR